jgi:hypothetical protein
LNFKWIGTCRSLILETSISIHPSIHPPYLGLYQWFSSVFGGYFGEHRVSSGYQALNTYEYQTLLIFGSIIQINGYFFCVRIGRLESDPFHTRQNVDTPGWGERVEEEEGSNSQEKF